MQKIIKVLNKLRVLEIVTGLLAVSIVTMYIANNFIARTNSASDLDKRKEVDAQYYALNNFYANSGYFPSVEDYDDPSWREENLPNLSSSSFGQENRDQITDKYTYIPKQESEDCEDKGAECSSYLLSVELSDGTPYILVSE